MSETQWTPQISYYLAQIKDLKPDMKVYVIDARFSQTAVLMESMPNFKYVGIANGTDAALVAGMTYEILKNKRNELYTLWGASDDTDLRKKIGEAIYGVFDTESTDGDTVNKSTYFTSATQTFKDAVDSVLEVPAGASWSAYVFGTDNTLVTAGLNKGTSIYPDEIGYNVRDYNLPRWDYKTQTWTAEEADELAGKHTYCYGQTVKTPEWASGITGVSADMIRELANLFVTSKVTVWTGSGFQRCTESEEIVRSWICFNALVKNYGEAGRSFGSVGAKDGKGNGGLAAKLTGLPPKTEGDLAKTDGSGNVVTDPTKGGYDKADGTNRITGDQTLGARFDGTFCTIDPSAGALPSDYAMESWGTKSNLTPCFTWMENVEASLMPAIDSNKNYYTGNGTAFAPTSKKIRPARWNTGSNQTVSAPVKWLAQMAGNQYAVTAGNSNYHVGMYKKTDASLIDGLNPYGYVIEFITICDNVMTPSCRYADLILPGSMGFERYTISGNSWGAGRNYVFTGKAINPPAEAKCELEIGLEIAKAFGKEAEYKNGIVENSGETFEEAFWRSSAEATTPLDQNGNAMSWEQAKKGYFVKLYNPYNDGYKGKGNSGHGSPFGTDGINTEYKAYRENPVANPKKTYTGKIEAYSLRYMEDYEARFFTNIDSSRTLVGSGKIYTKSTAATVGSISTASSQARFVYPVPMYIPLIEGRHADGSHPIEQGLYGNKEYNLTLNTWHIMYRSHSTHNSSGLLNEVKYYKRDYKGEPTYFTKDLQPDENGITNYPAITDYTKGAYETCWLNPLTASNSGIVENDLVVIENDRGAIVASAHLSQRVSPGAVYIGHGSWYNPVSTWTSPTGKQYQNIDVGGCANTLTNTRPSRMCQGMTLANDCRVKISKA